MLPTLFLSHGSPMLPVVQAPARDFLAGLGDWVERGWGRPRAILMASAHWETPRPAVNAVAHNATIHDFRGFPPELYALSYPAPGDPALAERVTDLLADAGLPCDVDMRRGLDHGAWCPLLLAWPAADIPVVQLSVQSHLGPAHHLQLGQAVAELRREGVLVIGSGAWTHDLRRFRGQAIDAPEMADVVEFSDWMDEALVGDRLCDLLTYRTRAPHAVQEHPTEEHLLPLYVAMGAAGADARPQRLHQSANYGILRMDAYAFA